MPTRPLTILYITGTGRSGTTILGNILGQLPGFFHTGELRFIWTRGVAQNWPCGCGVPFRQCEVWSSILHRAFGDWGEISQLNGKITPPQFPLFGIIRRNGKPSALNIHLQYLRKLYDAIRASTHSRVIIDSSKIMSHGRALGKLNGIDLVVLHMTRDPRGVAYSRRRRSAWPRDEEHTALNYYKHLKSSWIWNSRNLEVETSLRRIAKVYIQLRYEDFIADPPGPIGHILERMNEKVFPLPFRNDYTVKLNTTHTLSGNPGRFLTGDVKLKLDDEWKVRLSVSEKAFITLFTWPLLVRYGYLRGNGVRGRGKDVKQFTSGTTDFQP